MIAEHKSYDNQIWYCMLRKMEITGKTQEVLGGSRGTWTLKEGYNG